MTMVDLAVPLRNALINSNGITSLLESYKGSYPIFTRRPVPDDAPDICIVISSDITSEDADGINDRRLVIQRDIFVYGVNEPASKVRTADQLARRIHSLFHHSRHVVEVDNYSTVLVTAIGPLSIPQDDQSIALVVSVTVTLAKRS